MLGAAGAVTSDAGHLKPTANGGRPAPMIHIAKSTRIPSRGPPRHSHKFGGDDHDIAPRLAGGHSIGRAGTCAARSRRNHAGRARADFASSIGHNDDRFIVEATSSD
jgi:hypothetical protein